MRLHSSILLCLLFLAMAFPIIEIPRASAFHSGLPVLGVWSPAYNSANITDLSLTPATELTVTINVTDVTDLLGYHFFLYYDPAILTVVRVGFEGTLFGSAFSTVENQAGRLSVQVFSLRTVSGAGVLIFITVETVGVGMSSLGLGDDVLYGQGLQPIPHETLSGCFRNWTIRQPFFSFRELPAPGFYETSEFMIGRIAVGIIIPESNGPLYNWTDAEIDESVAGIMDAMAWWASQEPDAGLEFAYEIHTRVPTSYEPIEMSPSDYYLWASEAMSYLGYSPTDLYMSVLAYDNDLRDRLGTDWSFTIFLVDSDPNNHFGNFLGSTLYEFAFIAGPFFVMSRRSSWAWNPEQYATALPAHATGHIFRATDEYNGYREYSGYLYTPDFEFQLNLMNRNDLILQESTKEQVGWRDCDGDHILDPVDTYPAILLDQPQPAISDLNHVFRGATVDVPFPNMRPGGRDLTINKISSVRYSFDQGPWSVASPADGGFDEALENFTIPLQILSSGIHTLTVESENSAGNLRSRSIQFELQPAQVLVGTLDLDPDVLVLRSRGRYLTAYIELPSGFDAASIDPSSILLNGTITLAPQAPLKLGDNDLDGILDLMVKFSLQEVKTLFPGPGSYSLEIQGKLSGGRALLSFTASASVRVLLLLRSE